MSLVSDFVTSTLEKKKGDRVHVDDQVSQAQTELDRWVEARDKLEAEIAELEQFADWKAGRAGAVGAVKA